MSNHAEEQYPYFRFDVEGVDQVELQEWRKLAELGGITAAYMEKASISRQLGRCVEALINPAAVECI
jgi:hypothetical protein